MADSAEPAKISEDEPNGKLSPTARKLLEAVAKEAGNTTVEYYKMIGVNAYQGNQAKNDAEKLITEGWKFIGVLPTGKVIVEKRFPNPV